MTHLEKKAPLSKPCILPTQPLTGLNYHQLLTLNPNSRRRKNAREKKKKKKTLPRARSGPFFGKIPRLCSFSSIPWSRASLAYGGLQCRILDVCKPLRVDCRFWGCIEAFEGLRWCRAQASAAGLSLGVLAWLGDRVSSGLRSKAQEVYHLRASQGVTSSSLTNLGVKLNGSPEDNSLV